MPSMSSAQDAAFESANSGSLSIEAVDVQIMVTGILVTLVFIWFCWICVSAYQTLRRPGATATDAGGHCVRALFVTIVILALLTFT
jgi:integrating conjugative element protein (TIGR03758 family)